MSETPPPPDRPGGEPQPGPPPWAQDPRAQEHPGPQQDPAGQQHPGAQPYPGPQQGPAGQQQSGAQPYPGTQPYPGRQQDPAVQQYPGTQPYPAVQQGSRPSKPEPLPVEPRPYHHFYRTPAHRWWKPILLLLLVGVASLVVQLLAGGIAIGIDYLLGNTTQEQLASGELALSPSLLLATNLSLAFFIPAGMLAQWLIYGQRPRWLSSVQGGVRWRWLGICAAIIAPVWIIYGVVELLLTDVAFEGTRIALWLTIIVLTTPLQAAGEEYGLRGTVSRSVAAWIPDARIALVVATAVSSVVFMLLHVAADPWLNVYYFTFGVIACLLTWRTGGLEAAIAYHVINNLLAFTSGVLVGGIEDSFERGVGAGSPAVLLPLVLAVLVGVVIDRVFSRSRLRRVTAPANQDPPAVTRPASS